MTRKTACAPLGALACTAALVAAAGPAAACGQTAYLAQVCIVANAYCPSNTLEAVGQAMKIESYPDLFSVIGTTFGGDGRTAFMLPDLRGRAPAHAGQGAGLTDHPVGQTFGQQGVTQTVDMLAPHTHAVTVTGDGGTPPQGNTRPAAGTAKDFMPTGGVGALLEGVAAGGNAGTVTVGTTGRGSVIPTIPPELAVRYCIVVSGSPPPRP